MTPEERKVYFPPTSVSEVISAFLKWCFSSAKGLMFYFWHSKLLKLLQCHQPLLYLSTLHFFKSLNSCIYPFECGDLALAVSSLGVVKQTLDHSEEPFLKGWCSLGIQSVLISFDPFVQFSSSAVAVAITVHTVAEPKQLFVPWDGHVYNPALLELRGAWKAEVLIQPYI